MDGESQLSEKQLSAGYWFVTHKLFLRNTLIFFLILCNMVVWGYVVFSLVFAFGVEYLQDRQIASDVVNDRFVNLQGIRELTSPKDIVKENISTLASAGERIDILARVRNPNKKWLATFDYYFETDKGPSQSYKSFLAPAQSKLLLDLDVPAGSFKELKITNLVWTRDLNYSELVSERERFTFSEAEFVNRGEGSATAGDRAVFTITNNSNFNFYKPVFQVLLKNGTAIVGVQTLTIDRILSGQSYPVDIRWFEDVSNVTDIEVIPDINYRDQKVYLPF